jgi:hypothetical protein
VSPVRYELGSYISEDGIVHSHRRENLKFFIRYISLRFVCRCAVCCVRPGEVAAVLVRSAGCGHYDSTGIRRTDRRG